MNKRDKLAALIRATLLEMGDCSSSLDKETVARDVLWLLMAIKPEERETVLDYLDARPK